jgi:hypothetical protein
MRGARAESHGKGLEINYASSEGSISESIQWNVAVPTIKRLGLFL